MSTDSLEYKVEMLFYNYATSRILEEVADRLRILGVETASEQRKDMYYKAADEIARISRRKW